MRCRHWIVGAAGALGLALLSSAGQAAPAGSALGSAVQTGNALAEKVAVRCWWSYGRRHCREYGTSRYYSYPSYYGRPYYGYRARGYRDPDQYPVGSRRWWDEMDRQDRGGSSG